MRKKKLLLRRQKEQVCDLFLVATLIDAVDRVGERLTQTPALTDAEKAPYQAAIDGLGRLLVDRAIAMGNGIISRKEH